ncbi:lysine--tRNA ligase [Thiothrix litoralis]|uniref:Lysine--tRNA ligase n=1 Tax=Thiothrix litoralis TaxID=2891210 RepID=A0ABX7WXS4_9GAMM|nr:lysine--tRNA ligase [Thiothrix litoralis]QTR47967.1 lysine--tRNA ligase [Thiothrix litoralis]
MSEHETPNDHHDENKLITQRREKLAKLREQGTAFPNDVVREHKAADLHAQYGAHDKPWFEENPIEVTIAGRMMLKRLMGKASFATISDVSGRIQLYSQKNVLGDTVFEDYSHWDLGDIIWASGVLFKTQTGELSVKVKEIRLLTKSLRPLPEKFHGLTDHEQRYRQRYIDLIMNHDTRDAFMMRSKIVAYIRNFFLQRDYLEVETPMLQTIPGGAVARPFITHHNALDLPMYMRIAPELFLKRLVVGGFERVFEINRNFRNEGLSTRHNPEFTMIEFYQAYATYHDLMDLTESLMRGIATDVVGSHEIVYQGETFDFSQPFTRISVRDSILHFNPDVSGEQIDTLEGAKAVATKLGIPLKDSYGLGKVQIEIFEKTVEHRLLQPTFITEYPAEVSPLARRNDNNPFITDRFEFFVGGREIGNGFSELNDAEDQAERFMQQVADKDAGDDEAMHYDADYIRALEYGMPPTAGEGIGIDRLVMLFTDAPSIRDVILFPHMRPEH